jgi:mannose/fructose-specific phosphotransferase system component IIA
MATCLQQAVEKILGKQENLFPYTNLEDSLAVLLKKINENIVNTEPQHIVCFVDLAGGSCWNLANMVQKQHSHVVVIAGVNMPMLISYFSNLNQLSFNELIEKTINDGRRGIFQPERTK